MPSVAIDPPDTDVSERQPLLGTPAKDPDDPFTFAGTNLRVILPALMVCAFLAAFDVTVVAAIYPIM
jgi:hypothetical protein